MTENVAIIGAGQSGAAAAARLRSAGFDGQITLFGAETQLPYQRPPLSKQYLGDACSVDRLLLRSPQYWRENRIDVKAGCRVEAVDTHSRTLTVGRTVFQWDKLLFATGTLPRRLPFQNAEEHVHHICTIDDVDRLRPTFRAGKRLLVVGGGFIGLETAAVARKTGLDVTVVEQAPRILNRVVCEETACYFRTLHENAGVKIRVSTSVTRIERAENSYEIYLDGDEVVVADIVLAGIGVVPNIALAEAAGLAIEDGIKVDLRGRTSAVDVWASGDCASFPLDGRQRRLENVQNAIDLAEIAAMDMLGQGGDYRPNPWFWSDQFETKLQIAGLNDGYDRVIPTFSSKGRSHWYFKAGRMIAVDAIDDARSFMTAKKLLERSVAVDPAAFEHPDFHIQSLLA
jgi:3-phenylpropionate/trans-cinnamate dioxygenase ferredoxin reductase component